MKRNLLLCTALLLAVSQSSKAQFLNKLKKKAEAAVTKAVAGTSAANNDNYTTGAPSDNSPGGKASNAAIEKYGKQLFTLQQSERLVYGELSLSMKADGAHVKTVTRNNGKYYLYDNGTQSGPFNTPPVHLLDDWKRSYDSRTQNEDFEQVSGTSYVSAGVFEVDGKSYGKVLTVGTMYHNKKTKKFYAVTVKMEQGKMAYYLVTEKATRKLPAAGMNIIVSANGNVGGVIIPATQYNAKTAEDAYNYVLNDDVYLLLANGITQGPYKFIEANNTYLDNNGNYIQVATSSKKAVYVNGKTVINFNDDDSVNDGVFFANAKGTGGAWFDRGNLYFTDGTKIINNAIQPATSLENGKEVLNWVAINEKNVLLCKKEL